MLYRKHFLIHDIQMLWLTYGAMFPSFVYSLWQTITLMPKILFVAHTEMYCNDM